MFFVFFFLSKESESSFVFFFLNPGVFFFGHVASCYVGLEVEDRKVFCG